MKIKSLLVGILVAFVFALSCAKYEDGMYAEIKTPKGKIVCKLFFDKVPMTICNFVGLAQGTINTNKPKGTPFYDGLTFHRVVADFMIQGGCPQGNGTGNPGYQFPDEFHPSLRHEGPGILSMANSGPNTNGSQFFITHKATQWLDNRHSIFGKVIQGQEVVNKIQQGDAIESIRIVRSGKAAKQFKADQASFDIRLAEAKAKVEAKTQKAKEQTLKTIKEKWPKIISAESGLMYVVTKEGKGAKPKTGTTIKAHYTGTLLDGTKFDSSVDRGQPFEFQVGVGRVIRGWDEAFLDMKRGEKRTLIIPPELGYGSRNMGRIPPNSFLVFDVELIDF